MCQPSPDSENQVSTSKPRGRALTVDQAPQAQGHWDLVITHLLNLLRLRQAMINCDPAPFGSCQDFEEFLLWSR